MKIFLQYEKAEKCEKWDEKLSQRKEKLKISRQHLYFYFPDKNSDDEETVNLKKQNASKN